MPLRVFAIAAHPDDIEFSMAGTLILLGRAGAELHYMNVADGSCGSTVHDGPQTAAIRLEEARRAADRIGARFHPPLAPDLLVLYEERLLRRLAAIVREVAPDILLLPSPQDYMEDHMTVARLGVTAAFVRGMTNFATDPPREPIAGRVVLYHAQPYGNRDGLGRLVQPDFFVNIDAAIDEKEAMLAEHKSQKSFLDETQGVGAYLEAMRQQAAEMGALCGRCRHAEGWRRHNPLGFCGPEDDPLRQALGDQVVA